VVVVRVLLVQHQQVQVMRLDKMAVLAFNLLLLELQHIVRVAAVVVVQLKEQTLVLVELVEAVLARLLGQQFLAQPTQAEVVEELIQEQSVMAVQVL
jgi:Na+/glutamate symporter